MREGILTSHRMSDGFDDKWFKAQKRRLGITNAELGALRGRDHTVISKLAAGGQPMTMDWAKAFAEVFSLPLSEVIEKTGMVDGQTARDVGKPSFSEGDAVLWIPQSGDRRQVNMAEAAGARPGVDVWRVRGSAMALAGLLDGDFILVDSQQAERVRPGDIVIAQVYNPSGATTVLRCFEPPVLLSASADPAERKVHVVDGVNVLIRGKVTASWRGFDGR